jgi:hypothetical protein
MKDVYRTSLLARVCILVILSMALPAFLFAQGAGFGAVSGVVQDSTGAVVGGAHVVLDNEAKGIHRETDSTSSGNFDFLALVPAPGYTVKITKAGFGIFDYKALTVLVGETITLTPHLAVAGSAQSVEVTGEAPVVDLSKTETSQVFGSQQIMELPINGRRVDAFVAVMPGVVMDGAFGLLSFRGNPGGNSFLTDGNDTTNSYYDENAGRTRTYNISQDAVQEFQVVTSNFSAEYGKASGGVVNTVTRSGSNSIHGSAYEFFRNRTLNAVDRTTVNGLYPGGINPPEWRHQAGLSVGGPIVKNKLFYFFNGELMRRNAPAVSSNIGSGSGNNLFDGSGNIKANYNPDGTLKATTGAGASTSPYNVCVLGNATLTGVGQDRCDAAVAYLQTRVLPTLIPRKMDNNMLFSKIDWHPTPLDTISLSGNYLDFRSPNGIQTQLSLATGAAIGNNADTNVFDRTGRASWTRVVSPHAINEFRFGIFKDRQYDPASASLIPSIGPVALTVNSVSNVGFATNYPRLNPSELRLQFSDTYGWTTGKHNVKFGADISHVEDFVIAKYGQFGTYTYGTLNAFATDYSENLANAHSYLNYTQTFGNPKVDVNVVEAAIFLQDEWHLTPKLTITPGVRYDYTTIPQPNKGCNHDARFTSTCSIPRTKFNFAPRFGIAYAMDDKTSIHASYGLFQNRYTTSTIENLFVTNGVYQQSFTFVAGSGVTQGPVFPNFFADDYVSSTPGLSANAANILYADPKFRNPYSQQAEFGIQHEIAKNTSITMSYNWSRGLHLLQTRNDNILEPTLSTTANVLDSSNNIIGTYTIPVYTKRNPIYDAISSTGVHTPYAGGVYELQSSGNSYYSGLLVQVNRRYSSWFDGSISYTWSHAIDYNQAGAPTFGNTFSTSITNGDYAAERGSSSLDARHRFVANAVFTPKFMSGDGPFAKYVVNGWQLALVDVAQSSMPQFPAVSVSSSAPGLVNPGTRTLNGLSGSTRVPWQSISALNIGGQFRTDARLSKIIPIKEGVNVALGFEAFNIFNHLIPSSRQSQEYTATFVGATLAGHYDLKPTLTNGVPTYGTLSATQVTPDGTTARRAQAVIRINF